MGAVYALQPDGQPQTVASPVLVQVGPKAKEMAMGATLIISRQGKILLPVLTFNATKRGKYHIVIQNISA